MIKVSVIIPVYNARDYIVPCLESVVNQSLDDIEIILVDDHGSDDSMEAAARYLECNARGKSVSYLATPSNAGPGAARNVGIEAAMGEYVAFLDSDDWVEVDYCESLYKAAHKREADLAYCHISMDNRRDASSRVMYNPVVSNGDFGIKKHKFFLSRFVSYFTTYLYRKDWLIDNALRFPATRSSEDSAFLTCCLLAARRIAVVERPLYHYVIRGASLSTRTDGGRYLQKLSSFDEMISYARRHELYDTYKDEIEFIFLKKAVLMGACTYVENEDKPDSKVMSQIYDSLVARIPEYRRNKYFRKSYKIRALVRLIGRHPWLACKVIARRARKSRSI